jgi:cytochrome c biogenesis protein CcdA
MEALFDPGAFALGMVALINPCGFALLPAYLGFFLGMDEGEDARRSTIVALNRSQIVGLSMSAGFLAVFGTLGLFLAGTITSLNSSGWLPRITTVIGVALVVLGIAMLAGFQPLVKLPKLNKGGGDRSIISMFLFGVSYAVASLTCTIGIFLIAVGTSATGASFGERFGSFISYGIGMGLLATVLTLAVGFGKKGLVGRFRQLLPKINFVSGIVLVVVGIYVALYGIWSQQLNAFEDPTQWIDAIVAPVEGWQASVANWFGASVNLFGRMTARTTIMGWAFLLINVGLAVAGLLTRAAASSSTTPPEVTPSDSTVKGEVSA